MFPVAGGRHGRPESLGRSRRRRDGARLHRIGLRLEHVQSSHPGAARRRTVVVQPSLYDVHHSAGAAGPECRVRRTVGRAARPPDGGDGRGALLRHRARSWRRGPGAAPVAPRVPRDGHRQRHRLRAWLHLAGQHAGEVVPRPPGHGHRDGHHGLRRRRVHRRLPERVPDGPRRRGDDGDGAGRRLSGGDARRLAADAVAAARLASRRAGRRRSGHPR